MKTLTGVEYYKPEAHFGDITFEESPTMKAAEAKARRLSIKLGEAFAVEREIDREGRFVRDVQAARFADGFLDFRDRD